MTHGSHYSSRGINEDFLKTQPGLRAKVLDGKKLSGVIQNEIAAEVKGMVETGKKCVYMCECVFVHIIMTAIVQRTSSGCRNCRRRPRL